MRRFFVVLFYLMLCCHALLHGQQTAVLSRIERATVFILQAEGESLSIRCVGSGTLVRSDGLILTNAHHVVRSSTCTGDTLIVAMSIDAGAPPIPKYRAEIVQADSGLDIAILRIVREFDGRLIERANFPILPFVEVAVSDDIQLDRTVSVVGYSGLGNDPVTTTRATISGFIDEPSGGTASWVKMATFTPIAGTVTGGGVYNAEGQLIGIPTTVPVTIDNNRFNCIALEDTNEDGVINDSDRCVPLGEPITAIRPIAFARPLIRAASLGLKLEILTAPRFSSTPLDRPRVTRVFSAPFVIEGMPSTVVGALPAGTTSHYVFFDYENMTPQTVFEVRVSIDGVPNPTFSLPTVRWSGAQNGLWYVGSSGQPYPNGIYEFRIFIDGIASATHRIVIGEAPTRSPSCSNVVFGLLDSAGNLEGNGYVLPTGVTATARFIFQNLFAGLTWSVIWYYNGVLIARTDDAWRADNGESGSYAVSLQPQGGLTTGKYRAEIYFNGLLSCTGDFVIAGARQAALPVVFSNLEFLRSEGLLPPRGNPASTFPDGAGTLYARFDWQQIASGTPWRLEWLVDGIPFYTLSSPWSNPENGLQYTMRLTAPSNIPDGSYSIRLYVNNILLATASVSVGIGQLAIDRLAQSAGVSVRGRIVDADTKEGIAGVMFILISEDFSVREFTWNQEQVYDTAITDRSGYFELQRPLVFNAPYSVMIAHQGYLPISADGFSVKEDSPNPLELLITLTRD